uniref:Putative secreted protein n=1 Tax=Anopheles darlingi TaxID=43151 RepID=A0A2M4DPL7_ANODA
MYTRNVLLMVQLLLLLLLLLEVLLIVALWSYRNTDIGLGTTDIATTGTTAHRHRMVTVSGGTGNVRPETGTIENVMVGCGR